MHVCGLCGSHFVGQYRSRSSNFYGIICACNINKSFFVDMCFKLRLKQREYWDNHMMFNFLHVRSYYI